MIDGLPAFVGNCVRAMLRKGGAVGVAWVRNVGYICNYC